MSILRLSKTAAFRVFEFKDPDTGYNFVAKGKADLMQQIISYRLQNELPPIELLPHVVENYLCSLQSHIGCCEEISTHRSIMRYLQGGITLFKNMAYKRFVSQEVADKRAEVCLACPNNINPERGAFDTWANMVAEATIGDRKSMHHDKLFECALCQCNMRAKVFYGDTIELSAQEFSSMREVQCWQTDENSLVKIRSTGG